MRNASLAMALPPVLDVAHCNIRELKSILRRIDKLTFALAGGGKRANTPDSSFHTVEDLTSESSDLLHMISDEIGRLEGLLVAEECVKGVAIQADDNCSSKAGPRVSSDRDGAIVDALKRVESILRAGLPANVMLG